MKYFALSEKNWHDNTYVPTKFQEKRNPLSNKLYEGQIGHTPSRYLKIVKSKIFR